MALAPKFKKDPEEDKLLAGFRQTGATPATPVTGGVFPPPAAATTGAGFRTSPDVPVIGTPVATTGGAFPSAVPAPGQELMSSRTDFGGARIAVPAGQAPPQFTAAAVPGISGVAEISTPTTRAGGTRFFTDRSGLIARPDAIQAFEAESRAGEQFIRGEGGFRAAGEVVAQDAPSTEGFRQPAVPVPDTSADVGIGSRRLATPLRDFGEGGPARFEGLSAEEIVTRQEQEALAEDTVAGFRTAQGLQGRRLRQQAADTAAVTAEAQRAAAIGTAQAKVVKAAADASKLGKFKLTPARPDTSALPDPQTGLQPKIPGSVTVGDQTFPFSDEDITAAQTEAERRVSAFRTANPDSTATAEELFNRAYQDAVLDIVTAKGSVA